MGPKLQKNLLIVIIIAMTVYSVFFLKLEITRYRIFHELWNLGHIVLFIGINYVFYKKLINKLQLSVFKEFLIILVSSLVAGFCIEILQTYTGRDKSNYDILLDVVGAVIAFMLFSKALVYSNSKIRILFATLVFTFTVVSLYPMYINITDAIYQSLDFPKLLTNNSKREITRFKKNNVDLDIVEKEIAGNSKKVLSITFKPARYATVSLKSFNSIWTSYNSLIFSIYNPESTLSTIIIRIHDHAHELSGFSFNDRFNSRHILNPGWNTIRIKLSDVKHSPVNRDMNMAKVTGLMIFKMNSLLTETLFLSQIELVK